MSTSEHIFLHTKLPLQEAAQQLATAVGGEVVRDEHGNTFVGRPIRVGDLPGECGGEVTANLYGAPPDPEPNERSAFDGYDTVIEIRCTLGDEATQQAEAYRIFADITDRLGWPALLVHNLDTLIAASHPQRGRTRFRPGTSPDPIDQALWEGYVAALA
jgi:hypothetical protein